MSRLVATLWLGLLVSCRADRFCEEETPYDVIFGAVDSCSGRNLCNFRGEAVVDGNVVASLIEPGPYVDRSEPSFCQFGFTPEIKERDLDGHASAEKAGYQKGTIAWHLDQDDCFRGKQFTIPLTPIGGCP